MENWIQDAIDCWNSSNTDINPPASISEIENVEIVLKFKFPEDFKQLYLVVNGFENYEWQEHMFSFWSLDRIVEEYKEFSDNDFIGFCDFLIVSHCIGFRKSKQGIYKDYPTIDYKAWEPIAQSFEEVIGLINTNSGDIY